jgi:hypothetical protein
MTSPRSRREFLTPAPPACPARGCVRVDRRASAPPAMAPAFATGAPVIRKRKPKTGLEV